MPTRPAMPYRMTADRPPLPPAGGCAVALVVTVPVAAPSPSDPGAADYALRAGLQRLMRLLDERGVKADAAMPAALLTACPEAAMAVKASGWAIMGRGADPATVADDARALADFSGDGLTGWLGPGDDGMARALRAAGITRLHGPGVDDLPVWRATPAGPLLMMPRALALGWADPDAMLARFRAGLATLRSEAAEQPRVLTLSLPPERAGAPEHSEAVAQMLDRMLDRHDIGWMRAQAVADWYAAAVPPQGDDNDKTGE